MLPTLPFFTIFYFVLSESDAAKTYPKLSTLESKSSSWMLYFREVSSILLISYSSSFNLTSVDFIFTALSSKSFSKSMVSTSTFSVHKRFSSN